MTNLWILTNVFPYEPGEQFLETEIAYWAELSQIQITLVPTNAAGSPRTLPTGVSVDLSLTGVNRLAKLYSWLEVLSFPLFRREILWLSREGMLSLQTVSMAWLTTAAVLRQYKALKQMLKKAEGDARIVYSYWFDISAYAAALLRKEGLIEYLISRAHGADVYQERRPGDYMPLKRHFTESLDAVFAVSEGGRAYLQAKYSIAADRLQVARLGVLVGDRMVPPSPSNQLNLLSIASCMMVKRIDRIIDALALASQQLGPTVKVNWVHIGGGELKTELQTRADHILGGCTNLAYEFLGHLPNTEVRHYLETQTIDLLINTSESEGVPVSIMEAMSFGIPAIAPAVGGVPEIVNQENGWLLSPNPTTQEIADALSSTDYFKIPERRKAAKRKIESDYNAAKNYRNFIQRILDNQKTLTEDQRHIEKPYE